MRVCPQYVLRRGCSVKLYPKLWSQKLIEIKTFPSRASLCDRCKFPVHSATHKGFCSWWILLPKYKTSLSFTAPNQPANGFRCFSKSVTLFYKDPGRLLLGKLREVNQDNWWKGNPCRFLGTKRSLRFKCLMLMLNKKVCVWKQNLY